MIHDIIHAHGCVHLSCKDHVMYEYSNIATRCTIYNTGPRGFIALLELLATEYSISSQIECSFNRYSRPNHSKLSVWRESETMMKLQQLIFLTTALVESALALHRSPLFGGYAGGDPFDDGAYAVVPPVTGIKSLIIRHGDSIDGIQVVYALENGQNITSAYHGGLGGKADLIQLADGEYIARIQGEMISGGPPTTQYLTSITLYTRNVQDAAVKWYGPFGKANGHEGVPFSFAGVVVGFYGRSGTYLDAIGFDIDVADFIYPFYSKTSLVGGNGGDAFDDTTFLPYFPIRIKTLVVRHGDNIDGIEKLRM